MNCYYVIMNCYYQLDMGVIKYPHFIKSILKFFGYEDEVVYAVRITMYKERTHRIKLLLLINGQDAEGRKNYCLSASMDRFLSPLTKHNRARFYCNYCLHRFSEERILSEHIPHCATHCAKKDTDAQYI